MKGETRTPPAADKVMQLFFSYVPTQALISAVELNLFDHVHQGSDTLEQLAAATGASARGLGMLADALCSLDLLSKQDDRYALTPSAEFYLVSSSRAYLGGLVVQTKMVWERWNNLTHAVKTGTGVGTAIESDHDEGAFFAEWVDALFNLNFPAAQGVAERLAAPGQRVLDVGAGSAVWSLAFATRHDCIRVTAVDRRQVVDKVTRPFTERLGAAERYSFKTGNFRDLDLGEQEHDVALLGHILHSEGEEHSRRLLSRLHRALTPGGALVVAEMVPDEERSKATFPLLFGLNMLLHTEEGQVFTPGELEQMATGAGFSRTEWIEVPAPSPLLVAYK